jgi:hypothetical protein
MSENSSDGDNLARLLWHGGIFVATKVSDLLKEEFGRENLASQVLDCVVDGMTSVDTRS